MESWDAERMLRLSRHADAVWRLRQLEERTGVAVEGELRREARRLIAAGRRMSEPTAAGRFLRLAVKAGLIDRVEASGRDAGRLVAPVGDLLKVRGAETAAVWAAERR